jgi:uncharacterized protein (TIGR02246 family)
MHKHLVYLLTLWMVLVCFSLTAQEQMNNEEAAIRQMLSEYMKAFNEHDAKSVAAFWTKDGDLINGWGQLATNRTDVERVVSDNFNTMLKGSNVKETVEFIHFIKPDVALVDVDHVTYRMKDIQGKEHPPLVNHNFYVLIKKDGKWQIVSSRIYPLRELNN